MPRAFLRNARRKRPTNEEQGSTENNDAIYEQLKVKNECLQRKRKCARVQKTRKSVDASSQNPRKNMDSSSQNPKKNIDSSLQNTRNNIDSSSQNTRKNMDSSLQETGTGNDAKNPQDIIECPSDSHSDTQEDNGPRESEDSTPAAYNIFKKVSSDDVHNHIQEQIIESGKNRGAKFYRCLLCKKWFWRLYGIRRHMPVHTDERKYSCSLCDKAFRQSSTLSRHMTVHKRELKYKCEVCNKVFSRSSTLDKHLKTHSPTKEFVCQICDKAFHQKGNLKSHMFTHTGEKPYTCAQCGKAFRQKSNLAGHTSTVHKVIDSCTLCGVTFSKKRKLQEHMSNCRRGKAEAKDAGKLAVDKTENSLSEEGSKSSRTLMDSTSLETRLHGGASKLKSTSVNGDTTNNSRQLTGNASLETRLEDDNRSSNSGNGDEGVNSRSLSSEISRLELLKRDHNIHAGDDKPTSSLMDNCSVRQNSSREPLKPATVTEKEIGNLSYPGRRILPAMPRTNNSPIVLRQTPMTPKLCSMQDSPDSPIQTYMILDQPNGAKLLVPVKVTKGGAPNANSQIASETVSGSMPNLEVGESAMQVTDSGIQKWGTTPSYLGHVETTPTAIQPHSNVTCSIGNQLTSLELPHYISSVTQKSDVQGVASTDNFPQNGPIPITVNKETDYDSQPPGGAMLPFSVEAVGSPSETHMPTASVSPSRTSRPEMGNESTFGNISLNASDSNSSFTSGGASNSADLIAAAFEHLSHLSNY